jgi:predicted DNA-binding ribbon-helix-helix protein
MADMPKRTRLLEKRSVSIAGHRTSVAIEPEFWNVLKIEAAQQNLSFAALVAAIDRDRGERPLASALRLHALAAVQVKS